MEETMAVEKAVLWDWWLAESRVASMAEVRVVTWAVQMAELMAGQKVALKVVRSVVRMVVSKAASSDWCWVG